MERNKKTLLPQTLLLTLHLVCAVRTEGCPRQHDNLTCYNDFNRTITCVWNSTDVSDLAGTMCTIHAEMVFNGERRKYSSSCDLEPIDVSTPALKKCSLVFNRDRRVRNSFQSFHVLSFNLRCNPAGPGLNMDYKPSCHIKLNPPEKPEINFTTISWIPMVTRNRFFESFTSQLQWKREDQPWSEAITLEKQNDWDFEAELDEDLLIKGETYEARVRVHPADNSFKSTWSDWSPTASWVSPIGKPKPPEVSWNGLGVTVIGAAAFTLFLAIVLFKTDRTTWIYMVKRIRGPPVPNPAKSFLQDVNFQSWLSPHFTNEFQSFLKPVEFVSVELTCNVDGVAPYGPEMALQEKMKSKSSHNSTNPSFSNPSYTDVDPPPPITSLTAGNLEPCPADTPYGPVGSQSEAKTTEQDRKVEGRGKEMEILQLLSKGSSNREMMQVILDYNKVEKLQAEHGKLQSLDSGVCSREEVSQESLEADSINVTDSHDEEPQGKEEREKENGKDVDFRKLFGNISGGGIFSKGSIQICSDYERVQKLQTDSNELLSLDSGVSSGGEEQVSQEESSEDVDKSTESTSFLFPPSLSSALPCSLPFLAPLPFSFSGPGLSPAQQPCHMLGRIAQMSTSRSVEPSGDGYMPVTQEQN
ncbi:uncharacterized protein [Thunnus thynnus]|uniref:uncharacterized protein isoform X3 n=1 Tax=Thunnus thynnus TaxID=8237 RepID=UPI003526E516